MPSNYSYGSLVIIPITSKTEKSVTHSPESKVKARPGEHGSIFHLLKALCFHSCIKFFHRASKKEMRLVDKIWIRVPNFRGVQVIGRHAVLRIGCYPLLRQKSNTIYTTDRNTAHQIQVFYNIKHISKKFL